MRIMVVRVLAIIGGLAIGVMTLMLAYAAPAHTLARATPGGILLLGLAGWAAMIAAVVMPRRQAGIAGLLFSAGVAWFVAEWDNPAAPVVMFTIGLVGFAAAPAFVLHATMALGGVTKTTRALAFIGYVITIGLLGVGGSLWFDPDPTLCGCPGNPLALADDRVFTAQLSRIGVWAGLVWLIGVIVVLVHRIVTMGRGRFRAIGGATICGLLFAALTAGTYLNGLASGALGSDETDRRLWVGQAIALTALAVAVIAGAMSARRAHRAVTSVVTELARGGADLRADLAARLGDPALEIAYPVDGGTRYVDSRGERVSVAEDGRTVLTPVRRRGVAVAAVLHRSDLDADRVESLASVVGLALEHERLNAEARAQLVELRRSGERIVAAGDAERRRLERDLHDGAQQHMVSLVLRGGLIRARHPGDEGVATALTALTTAAEELRATARRLSSVVLDAAGLAAALSALAESRPLTVRSLPIGRAPALIEATIYLLAERASRDSSVDIAVAAEDESVTATLECASEPALAELADRVATLGGTLVEELTPTGTTIVTARWDRADETA